MSDFSTKTTIGYVVDDLEGNFEPADDTYANISDVFDEISALLTGEYDEEDGTCGSVKTCRIKKIEIWINQPTIETDCGVRSCHPFVEQKEKPDLKFHKSKCGRLIAESIIKEIDPTEREIGDPLYETLCSECGEQFLATDMVDEYQDGDTCIECYEERPAVRQYLTAIYERKQRLYKIKKAEQVVDTLNLCHEQTLAEHVAEQEAKAEQVADMLNQCAE